MVHFLAEIIESKYPEINGFENELTHLHDASRGRVKNFQVKAIIHYLVVLSRKSQTYFLTFMNHSFASLLLPRISYTNQSFDLYCK